MPTYGNTNNMGTFVWVNSEQEAREYPVSPNAGLLLMNRNEPVIYMKQADAYGRSMPLEVYDLTKRVPPEPTPAPSINPDEYLKVTDLESRVASLVKQEFDKLMK